MYELRMIYKYKLSLSYSEW